MYKGDKVKGYFHRNIALDQKPVTIVRGASYNYPFVSLNFHKVLKINIYFLSASGYLRCP